MTVLIFTENESEQLFHVTWPQVAEAGSAQQPGRQCVVTDPCSPGCPPLGACGVKTTFMVTLETPFTVLTVQWGQGMPMTRQHQTILIIWHSQ